MSPECGNNETFDSSCLSEEPVPRDSGLQQTSKHPRVTPGGQTEALLFEKHRLEIKIDHVNRVVLSLCNQAVDKLTGQRSS